MNCIHPNKIRPTTKSYKIHDKHCALAVNVLTDEFGKQNPSKDVSNAGLMDSTRNPESLHKHVQFNMGLMDSTRNP